MTGKPASISASAENAKISFEGAVVLITGAARGIGRAHAALLAARGAKIVINDLGIDTTGINASSAPAEQAAAEIRKAGGHAIANSADITTEAGAADAVMSGIKNFGRLDAVINNAGFVRDNPFDKLNLDDLEQMLAVHVRGAFLITKAAWPVMVAQGYGRIVMTASNAGLYGHPGLVAYGAAKGAVIGLTRNLGLEGEALGIRVNAIAPLAYSRLNADMPDENLRSFFEHHARADQVAPLVALLAHRECPVNGQIFDVGAGRFTRVFFGEGTGYVNTDATIESVRDHFAEVLAPDNYTVPVNAEDNIAQTLGLAAASATTSPGG